MIKKSFVILIILLSIPALLFGFGSKEKDNSAKSAEEKALLKNLEKNEKLWKNKGIKNYTQEIIYSRSTFSPEQITITVNNNTVTNWKTSSGVKTFTEDFIKSLTIENMFEKARESLKADSNSPLEYKVSYNEELGYVTIFSCLPTSKENKNSTPIFDRGYRIEVVSFKITEAGL